MMVVIMIMMNYRSDKLEMLKESYNRLLERHYKAERYFEDKNIPLKDKEDKLKTYQDINYMLNFILDRIKKLGEKVTSKQILNGF